MITDCRKNFILQYGGDSMKRKIRRIGNSLGIVLPIEILKDLQLNEGDHVEIETKKYKGEIILRNPKITPITDDFESRVIDVVEKYFDVKRKISKRVE
jgi:antitoxin MazE